MTIGGRSNLGVVRHCEQSEAISGTLPRSPRSTELARDDDKGVIPKSWGDEGSQRLLSGSVIPCLPAGSPWI